MTGVDSLFEVLSSEFIKIGVDTLDWLSFFCDAVQDVNSVRLSIGNRKKNNIIFIVPFLRMIFLIFHRF